MSAADRGGKPELRISVIIPTWRDAKNLALLLPKLSHIPAVTETIVVNASRDSETEPIAQRWGAMLLKFSPPNRGSQMNAGAEVATGDVLLFQHADTHLEAAHVDAIRRALREPRIIGGAFYRKFDGRHPRLMWLEPIARFLSRNGGTLYGDQSVFVRRDVFEELGGFANFPLMEDMEFSKRLRAAGHTVLLDPPVHSSARRHLQKGAWRMTVRNALFIVLYKFGVSPARLHRWYYPTPELSRRPSRRGASGNTSVEPAAR
ncbi:MAG: TIGR04283 family arsenosugar biosynthesis glycosyltransferase [Chthoniobacterales bacterium]